MTDPVNSETAATEDRQAIFQPPKRPEWVELANAEGAYMDLPSVVPLDEASLIEQAERNTGLSNFGDDLWREPFRVLIKALNEESQLHLMGRLMVRTDILTTLEARLRIEEAYRLHPEIENEEIRSPLFIVGQGRSGTSEMLNLLARDPNNAVVRAWEAMFPCPPPETATYDSDPRIAKATGILQRNYRVVPELRASMEYGGNVPCENVHIHCLAFRSGNYINAHWGQVPSYQKYMAGQDPAIPYHYEKRLIKLLQWKNPRKQWVFKSPAAIVELPSILEVYPDVNFVMTTRDPIKSLSSITAHLGTLNWARSDASFIGGSGKSFLNPEAVAKMLDRIVDWLEDGSLPKAQFMAVDFKEYIADQLAAAERIYARFGIEMTPEGRAGMEAFVQSNRQGSRPKHNYATGSSEAVAKERAMFKRYQDYFNVPSEV